MPRPTRYVRVERADVEAMIDRLAKHWGFDPGNGWKQLGESPAADRALAYGSFVAMQNLLEGHLTHWHRFELADLEGSR